MGATARPGQLQRLTRRPNFIIFRRLALQLAVAAVLLVGCGAVYWHIEPSTPSFLDGLWLAFVTAATIGYGDVVPSTPASRLFSVLVLLLGFGVLSLVTAAIASAWVESRDRQMEREILRDVHREIRSLRDDVDALRAEIRDRRRAD